MLAELGVHAYSYQNPAGGCMPMESAKVAAAATQGQVFTAGKPRLDGSHPNRTPVKPSSTAEKFRAFVVYMMQRMQRR
ncbi:hypothetical protein Ancab_032302 [Ancistrocladus abbreviatus]